jgi:hypothetical protein
MTAVSVAPHQQPSAVKPIDYRIARAEFDRAIRAADPAVACPERGSIGCVGEKPLGGCGPGGNGAVSATRSELRQHTGCSARRYEADQSPCRADPGSRAPGGMANKKTVIRLLRGRPEAPTPETIRKTPHPELACQAAGARFSLATAAPHERGGRELSASGNVPFRSTYPPLKGSRSCRTVCPKPR